jgi:hypothetical protein
MGYGPLLTGGVQDISDVGTEVKMLGLRRTCGQEILTYIRLGKRNLVRVVPLAK